VDNEPDSEVWRLGRMSMIVALQIIAGLVGYVLMASLIGQQLHANSVAASEAAPVDGRSTVPSPGAVPEAA
jgi:hypothetical protein